MVNIFSKLTTGLGKILSARGDDDGRVEAVLNGNFAVVPSILVTGSGLTVYTVPGNKKARIWIEVNNIHATANSSVTFSLVPEGVVAGIAHQVLHNVMIPFESVGIRLGPYGLGPGAWLEAIANANNSIAAFVYVELFDV